MLSPTPTKRRPAIGPVNYKTVTRQVLRKKKKLDVLYLTANPDDDAPLRVDAEMRQVQSAIRGSKLRDNVELHYRPAADLDSLVEGLNDHGPGILHFSGHGNSDGLAVDSADAKRGSEALLSFELLADAIAATDTPPQVIVLNACYSTSARKTLLPCTKAIIAMSGSVGDVAATAFAVKFYAAIAAGQSLKSAFAQGKLAVKAVAINEADTPDLILGEGVNAAKLILA
jgi:hypothetical protein